MVLVIGATGLLGSEVVRQLRISGYSVRALARSTSNPRQTQSLQQTGAEVVYGDLKLPTSIEATVEGVEAIITTASSTLSRQPGDSIQTVDRDGYFTLIDCAEKAGVRHFVYTSIARDMKYESPLTRAKAEVAQHLRTSRMEHTVLAANFFMEVWLSPMLGFDPQNARATIYGSGTGPVGFVSLKDVARIAVTSLSVNECRNRTISVAGPANTPLLEVVQIVERLSGRTFAVEHVPEDALEAKRRGATDPLEQTFAALMLEYANGCPMDMKETLSMLPMRLTSVQEYAASVMPLESARA